MLKKYSLSGPTNHHVSRSSTSMQKWIMGKNEIITAGDSNISSPYFWEKRSTQFPYNWFNKYLKGANNAIEVDFKSFSINIPYTSHRSFLKLFLMIDEETNTEIPGSEHYNIFDLEFVKVFVFCF